MSLPKIVLQDGKASVKGLLNQVRESSGRDSFGVAVAYATVPGVRDMLESIVQGEPLMKSYWLFGLDDWITHPDAIELVMKIEGAKVRVASSGTGGGKFHPKLYWFSGNEAPSAMVLGSANLTRHGLLKNVEAVTAIFADGKRESAKLDAIWANAWKLGKPVTSKLLVDYRKKFFWARDARKKAGLLAKQSATELTTGKSRKRVVLESDAATIDPSLASTCWIEVGKITGFAADQLEIKAEQALFFGLPSNGGPEQVVDVRLPKGNKVSIRVQYFGNHMWRFLLPHGIPEVAGNGLRPGGKRSPYAAVFKRTGGKYSLCFLRLTSTTFKKLRKETEQAGTLGRTTAREYGWV